MAQTKCCSKCKQDKPIDEFYKSKTHSQGVMCYCKTCFNVKCIERWIQRKKDAIEYKGCKCEKCNLKLEDSHYSVFEFHHTDPSTKDFDWTKLRLRPWDDIKIELDKCQLLCANCHRIVHALEFPEQSESQ